jgi:hypothetical protein
MGCYTNHNQQLSAMPNFELIAFLCVTCGAGALMGLGGGAFFGSAVWGAVAGAVLGPVVAAAAMALCLYLGEAKQTYDD